LGGLRIRNLEGNPSINETDKRGGGASKEKNLRALLVQSNELRGGKIPDAKSSTLGSTEVEHCRKGTQVVTKRKSSKEGSGN